MATSGEDHVSIPLDDLAEGGTTRRATNDTIGEGDPEVEGDDHADQGEGLLSAGGEKAPDPADDAAHSLYGVFASDRTDLMLLGGYNSIIIFLDAGSDPANPTQCSGAQSVCSWIVFSVVMMIYAGRHAPDLKKAFSRCVGGRNTTTGNDEANKTSDSGFRWWFIPLRALVFGGFLLCMHNQPISCAISKGQLKDLRFVQATAMVLMSMVAGVTFGNSHYQAYQKRQAAANTNANSSGNPSAWTVTGVWVRVQGKPESFSTKMCRRVWRRCDMDCTCLLKL